MISRKTIRNNVVKAASVLTNIETEKAIRSGDKKMAIASTIANVGLAALDFHYILEDMAEKKFTEKEVAEGKELRYYLTKIFVDLTAKQILNAYLTASSLKSISKMDN